MRTKEQLNLLIAEASAIVGNQVKLADLLGIPKSHISEMKAGKRPCGWKIWAQMRVITGEDPKVAYLVTMVEELEDSPFEDAKKAAEGLLAMVTALPPKHPDDDDDDYGGGGNWGGGGGKSGPPNGNDPHNGGPSLLAEAVPIASRNAR